MPTTPINDGIDTTTC
jgi:Glycosyl hydrolase family 76